MLQNSKKNISYINCISISNKETNEDYVVSFKNSKIDIQGVIVADGIGSHYKAEKGAEFCAKTLKRKLEACSFAEEFNLKKFFREVQKELNSELRKDLSEEEAPKDIFGTTLICAVETRDRFLFAYLGNGSIWHLKGNFPSAIKYNILMPWNVANYLNPHVTYEQGKPSLYRFFAMDMPEEKIHPTVFEIEKDKWVGDIIVISSDGLFSNDNVQAAKAQDGTLWIGGYDKVILLFTHLKELACTKKISEEKVQKALENFKEELKGNIDDDTTLGVIYSSEAIEFQAKNYVKNNKDNQESGDV